MSINRRSFLKRSGLGMGVGLGLTEMLTLSDYHLANAMSKREGNVVVFQGDSITDARREKETQAANSPASLGHGYAALASAQLLGSQPEHTWMCYNRGISGHKVFQLAERWEEDCIDLQPDVLSILIGVNDFWHTLRHNYEGTVEIYESDYHALLETTKKALPDVKLIIGEPFVLYDGTAITEAWTPAFSTYQQAAKRVADAFNATWIPYQSLFDEALKKAPVSYWGPDGVHPSLAGNSLMANAWLAAFEEAMG